MFHAERYEAIRKHLIIPTFLLRKHNFKSHHSKDCFNVLAQQLIVSAFLDHSEGSSISRFQLFIPLKSCELLFGANVGDSGDETWSGSVCGTSGHDLVRSSSLVRNLTIPHSTYFLQARYYTGRSVTSPDYNYNHSGFFPLLGF